MVAPPSRRLSGGRHARRAEGEDAPSASSGRALGTAGKDSGATSVALALLIETGTLSKGLLAESGGSLYTTSFPFQS